MNDWNLKPFPFCGGPAEIDTRQSYLNYSTARPETAVAVYCRDCSAQISICRGDVPDVHPEEVVSLWNARTSADEAELARLTALLNTPALHNFSQAVVLEAAHQRERWAAEHDGGKSALDWFWLIGFLAQKVTFASLGGDREKALHHCISTASALANWHAAIEGSDTRMRPGAEPPAGAP